MTNIQLNHIESFITVVKKNSFSKAAKELNISQSSISSHISSLENALGITLLNRGARSEISLTDIGKKIYVKSCEIINLADSLEKIAQLEKTDNISIGTSSIPSQYLLPRILSQFSILHPYVKYTITQANSTDIHVSLLKGDIRIGFVGDTLDNKLFHYIKIGEDELHLITANIPKFQDMILTSFSDLKELNEPIILREKESGTRKSFEYILNKNNINIEDLNIIAEMVNNEAIKNSVIKGLGVSFISNLATETEVSEGKLLSFNFNSNMLSRDLFLCYKKDIYLSPKEQEFVDFIIEYNK